MTVALVVALVAGACIAAAVVYRSGRTVPAIVAARLYLWQRLKSAGLDSRVPPACVNELADRELARTTAAPLTDRLDALAIVVGQYLRQGTLVPALGAVKDILKRHGVTPDASTVTAEQSAPS